MSFLYKYNEAQLIIKYSQEFIENGTPFIYSIGNSSAGRPSILKSNTNGNVVWKFDYSIIGFDADFAFQSIIQTKDAANQEIYFLYATNGNRHFIVKINSAGSILLIKEIDIETPMGVFIVDSKINRNFYLVFSSSNDQVLDDNGTPITTLRLVEFDINIEILNKKNFWDGHASDMLLKSVVSYPKGIVTLFDHKANRNHIVDFNYNLTNKLNKSILIGNGVFSDFYSHDIVVASYNASNPEKNKYIVSGNNNAGDVLVLAIDLFSLNYLYKLPKSTGGKSSLCLINTTLNVTIYFDPINNSNSIVHNFSISNFSNLALNWSKFFAIGGNFFGIKRLNYNSHTTKLVAYTSDGAMLSYSGDNLETCITLSKQVGSSLPTNFTVENEPESIRNFAIDPIVIENYEKIGLTVDEQVICNPIVESPCAIDKDICKLYNDIMGIVINCLTNPSNFDTEHDFSPQQDCVNTILGLLLDFKLFIDRPDFENYQNAWYAIQSVLAYLSQLGNCNCENNLDVTDYASIQSGHLYLQSVGSVGNDSTKGMHLRWALRGALLQHLPKANYATNNYNFNKNDDFVKIYRANYKPLKVTLDFNKPPFQIIDTPNQKKWVYKISDKVFHIHFRSKTKYNAVVASGIDPIASSQLFIKNYGDALLEIENKTELSFKITPFFEINDSDSFVKLEVLSVLENKITAPKIASIRKKYATTELNTMPLISENIRSVRFTSTNAYVAKLEFEFYSDFIVNTKKANAWKYLGKYALTKETFDAYKRLEPQQHCIDNWLRYNDEAYVKVKNYQDKWNDDTLEPLNRIVTSVEKYIALSDDQVNIRAVEIFPFEDQDAVNACAIGNEDYDPLVIEENELPDENTGVAISYLDVLQMGSLDYHVARMIGLGTLDLNPLVFDGKYIYLSEYITFGDLQDGLGERQVQHLYCSLPTSLQDSRDCLPVDLRELNNPVPGVFYTTGVDGQEVDTEDDEDAPTEEIAPAIELTNEGYSLDGKTKYFTFYTEPFDDEVAGAPFYYIDNEFESSKFTSPVFAGFEYKKENELHWVKPEVTHSDYYFNNDNSAVPDDKKNETVELLVPENGKALYTHAVKESCTLIFSSYGINWFSRATSSEVTKKETIVITPANNLLPPANILPH